MSRVVVIGAGLAGLVSAIRLAEAGRSVVLISKGIGGLPLSTGTVDVLGYREGRLVDDPITECCRVAAEHPYATIGATRAREGVRCLAELVPDLLVGEPSRNVLLPTAVGALRPTALMPPSMAAGVARAGARWLLVGLRCLKDFSPALVAGNLNRTVLPGGGRLFARPEMIDLPARDGEADSSGVAVARALDDPAFRERLVAAVRPLLGEEDAVGLPAVLGLKELTVWQELRDALGREVFEIPLVPPSVPGLRLNERLLALASRAGVRRVDGVRVVGLEADGGLVTGVRTAAAGRDRTYAADAVVYAAGGFESGTLTMDSHFQVRENVFDLPLTGLGGGTRGPAVLPGELLAE